MRVKDFPVVGTIYFLFQNSIHKLRVSYQGNIGSCRRLIYSILYITCNSCMIRFIILQFISYTANHMYLVMDQFQKSGYLERISIKKLSWTFLIISLRVEIRISFASCYYQGAKFVGVWLNSLQTTSPGIVFLRDYRLYSSHGQKWTKGTEKICIQTSENSAKSSLDHQDPLFSEQSTTLHIISFSDGA